MTPGIVDTGQHPEQQSQQDKDDEDYNHHPRVTPEPDFLLLMIHSANFEAGICQAALRVVLSVRTVHL